MSECCYIGFDTSNYTTSVAIVSKGGNILANLKYPLHVSEGQRGLRQSDAVFSHIKSIPAMAREIYGILDDIGRDRMEISAVAYSGTPRSCEGSYMPCFLVGEALAESLASFLGIPAYRVSHQSGHIMAALYSSFDMDDSAVSKIISKPFAAFHVSGGTTDILLAKPDFKNVFSVSRIGGTNDVNAGQLIDRIGVKLGFSFPCGVYLDNAAVEFKGDVRHGKISVKGLFCNMSGLENKAVEMILNKAETGEVSAYTLDFISRTLEKLTLNLFDAYGDIPLIYAGGVMCSKYISTKLSQYGRFADAKFSSDNAAGVALLAREIHRR